MCHTGGMRIRQLLTRLNCFKAPAAPSTIDADIDSCATHRRSESQSSAPSVGGSRMAQARSLSAQARLNRSLSRELREQVAAIVAWGNEAPLEENPLSGPHRARASYQRAAATLVQLLQDPRATELVLESNRHITHLPPGVLPARLEVLNLKSCTSLQVCPDVRGLPALKKLNLRHCGSMPEPPDLSQSHALEELEMGGQLSALAKSPLVTHCPRLRILNLRRSRFVCDAPDVSNCPNLSRFDMFDVPTTQIPRGVLNLPASCQVSLSDAHIQDKSELEADYGCEHYQGPNLIGVAWRTEAEVAFWRRQADDLKPLRLEPEHAATWRACDTELGGGNLAVFLNRLRNTAEYTDPRYRETLTRRVGRLLDQLQQHPELLETCRVLADHALKQCDDLVAFGLLEMETLCANHHITAAVVRGEYDHAVGALVELGQGMHRLNQLDKISRQEMLKNRFRDPIEMQLFYLMETSNLFDLPVKLQALKYSILSGLHQEDIDDAVAQLHGSGQLITDVPLIHFLAEWEPMMALFDRRYPQDAQDLKTQALQTQERLRFEQETSQPGTSEYDTRMSQMALEFNAANEQARQGVMRRWVQGLLVDLTLPTAEAQPQHHASAA
jgi:hypothetical protein